MFKKIALATVAASLLFTGTSYAAPKMDKANTVKIALYKVSCESYSDRNDTVKLVIDDLIDAHGGMVKLVHPMSRLKTNIKASGDDKNLTSWCGIMDDQFETMEAALNQ